jgi:cell division protease FtsH
MFSSILHPTKAPPVKIGTTKDPEHFTYTQFVRKLKTNELQEVVLKPNVSQVLFLEKNGAVGDAQVLTNPTLWQLLTDENDVDVRVDLESHGPMNPLDIVSVLFLLFFSFVLIRAFFFSGLGGGSGGPLNMMQGDVELKVDSEVPTRFEDVEGIDSAKEELEEIVDFLQNGEKYAISGAKIPKGALLTGLPGTGKTLLARAIAGESGVPFINASGSSFVEMFVGVGAKRVRDLFAIARANEPCIIFIDEIDAIGKKRSAGGMASNDEREQTINQLLTEMDGFDVNTQIVVLAATNRADILDEALLRPGRFDRKISVSLPNVDGRERILGVHARDKNLSPDLCLRDVARQTTGFSGADLANLLNECAIRSVKDGVGMITSEIVEDTFQRIVVGAKGMTKFSDEKKTLVAYHEAGHAIVGAFSKGFDEVRKVSIIPRGDAGGVTFFQPKEEVDLYPKSYYLAQLRVCLGGRAAEEIIYGADEVTTGASGDYASAYQLAREMVTRYGFGKNNYDYTNLSPFSARVVDKEIDAIVKQCYEETLELLTDHRAELEFLKNELIEKEVVDGKWVYETLLCGNQDTGCHA